MLRYLLLSPMGMLHIFRVGTRKAPLSRVQKYHLNRPSSFCGRSKHWAQSKGRTDIGAIVQEYEQRSYERTTLTLVQQPV